MTGGDSILQDAVIAGESQRGRPVKTCGNCTPMNENIKTTDNEKSYDEDELIFERNKTQKK